MKRFNMECFQGMSWKLIFLKALAVFILLRPVNCSGSSRVSEWLKADSKIRFDASEVPHVGMLNRLNWVEKNERSTSQNYTFWDKADVYLFEWPGNVTLFDMNWPLVKWGRHRAKYVEDICGQEHTGIEMRAYADKFVHLTWGPYRLTKTYTPPLAVPRSILPFQTMAILSSRHSYNANNLNVVVVFDIGFAFDALLLAYSEGIIRVAGLEMAYAELSGASQNQLKFSISKGINVAVDKLVTQSCCLKSEFCPSGNFVAAYKEMSLPHVIYISSDGGMNFKQLTPNLPDLGSLRVVLSFPENNHLLLIHGNWSKVKMDPVLISSGTSLYQNQRNHTPPFLITNGVVQGSRLGLETSFILWDDCSVWYSSNAGRTTVRSLLYIHKTIMGRSKHHVLSQSCTFGENSSLAFGNTGKFALLDSKNTLFLGIDTKSNLSQLVALKVDMSLMLENTMLSVVPYFDVLEQPKLLYPPKFLRLPKRFRVGQRYGKRLAMRLLPKNVYPSDYIYAFFEEHARLSTAHEFFSLKPCQTSGLQVNNSITQRRKLYSLSPRGRLRFTISFKSRLASRNQLFFEPTAVLRYLNVIMKPASVDMVEPEQPRYWIKYNISVEARSSTVSNLFRINFYTKNDLRCNFQPRVPVFIKVEESPAFSKHSTDEDMSKSVYLKSMVGGEEQYLDTQKIGQTIRVETCPLKKQHNS